MQAASHLMVAIGTGAGAKPDALAGRTSVRRYTQSPDYRDVEAKRRCGAAWLS